MKPESIIAEYGKLKSDRSTWDSRWQSVLEWIQPHKATITEKNEAIPSLTYRSKVHDTKAIDAAAVLTSAHMSYITPLNENWLRFAPPSRLQGNDAVAGYFKKCSEIAMEEITASNFYPVIHNLYRDRAIPGTGCMMLVAGETTALNFRYIPLGDYCFLENTDGLANAMFREFQLTLEQAVEEFGEDKLGPKLMRAWGEVTAKPENAHVKYSFLQCVRERKERDQMAASKDNMIFGDWYVCLTDKVLVSEGGFQEFPFCVSRYERWGNSLWGFAPAYDAMPNVLSANYVRKLLKTLGEIAAFPRLLLMGQSKRNVDLRASGQTYVSREEAQLGYPKEWGTSGRFDVGMELLSQDHEAIEQFFHTPLFRMFASIDKQMTATEVASREREKLLMFAPSFTQFVADVTPMMLRIFALLARAGKFPDPPPELGEDNGDGTLTIPNPEVVYQSRIALAIKALHGEGFDRVMMRLTNVAEIAPDVFDNFDFDAIFRDLSRNEGVPESWLRLKEAVDELRAARAETQKQQQEVAMAEQAASAVSKVGGPAGVKELGGMLE